MKTDTIKYNVLKALAAGDTPMTCEELWDVMDEKNRPTPHTDDSKTWGNLTSHTATLWGDRYLDRRKRDAKNRPMEYWLAAKGRELLRENGDLPAEEGGDEPVPETTNTDDGSVERADPSAVKSGLGLGDPEVDSERALTETLGGIVSRLRAAENAVDNLRENAVTEMEMNGRTPDDVEDLTERVETLTAQVNALAERVDDGGEYAGQFAEPIDRLSALADDGYGLYEFEYDYGYAGNVVNLRVKAKPAEKCDKGPARRSDGDTK